MENFPYPAEYAFHAEDGSHQHADDGSELPVDDEQREEDEKDDGPHFAGVAPPQDNEEEQGETVAPSTPDAPAAVTSATYTLEGESTGSSSMSSMTAAAAAWWRQASRAVRDVLRPVRPALYEAAMLWRQGWLELWDMLFPSPPTPAQGEEAAIKERSAEQHRRIRAERAEQRSQTHTSCLQDRR